MAAIQGLVQARDGTGLGGVSVSDGTQVTVTDDAGSFILAATPGRRLFISVPSGWSCPEWFTVADPTGNPVFVMDPQDQTPPFVFGHITDLHLSSLPAVDALTKPDSLTGRAADGTSLVKPLSAPEHVLHTVGALITSAPTTMESALQFVVATGDLTDNGLAADYALLNRTIAESAVPFLTLPGNHDHYGHEREPSPRDGAISDSGAMGRGTFWRYTAYHGPRWWSRSFGGLHFVAVDWFSWRVGFDAAEQQDWIAADLAQQVPDTPVLFFTHDHMPTSFWSAVAARSPHVRIVGSLSGHWHTSRVVRVDGPGGNSQLHVNTSNTTFGGFDWAPAAGRLVRWDGSELALHTVAVSYASPPLGEHPGPVSATSGSSIGPAEKGEGPTPGRASFASALNAGNRVAPTLTRATFASSFGSLSIGVDPDLDPDLATQGAHASVSNKALTGNVVWQRQVPGAVHRHGPRLIPIGKTSAAGLVVIAWSDDDTADGGLCAYDPHSGELAWSASLGAPVKAGVGDDQAETLVACTVNGGLSARTAATGERLWSRQIGDPIALWVHATPLVADGTVFAGEYRTFGAYDITTGEPRWERHFPKPENYTSVARPHLADGILVVGFGPYAEHTAGLDAATGETIWHSDDVAWRFPSTDFVPDPADDTVVVVRQGGRVDKLDPRTGAVLWKGRLDAEFTGGAPLITADAVVCCSGLGTVVAFDRSNGAPQWSLAIASSPPVAFGPYRRRGGAAVGGVISVGERLCVAMADGAIHTMASDGTAHETIARLGTPITAAPALVGGHLVVATATGQLLALRL